MFDFLINLFKKQEPKEEYYPSHFLKVVLNPVAQSRGIDDNFNKEIQRIKEGKIVEIKQFNEHMLKSMIKQYEISVYEESFNAEDEYEFDSFSELGVVKYKK